MIRIGLGLMVLMLAGSADAQTWPSRPVEMLIPFPASSGVDVIGRAVAPALAKRIGQNVIITNRDGADGTVGFAALAAAQPDGHTIGFGPATPIANAPYLVKGVRYDVDSFAYICQIFENTITFAVGPRSKFTSARELFAAAARTPGKLRYGHAGTGSIPHLSVANLADALSLQFQPMPFRGDGSLIPSLLRAEVDFAALPLSAIRGQPSIRPIGIFADERHPAYLNVPTASELGVANGVPPGHNGLYAPKGLAPGAHATLENACVNAVRSDAVRQAVANTGQSIKYLNGADFRAQTAADYKFTGELIRRLGLAIQQ